MLKEKKTSKTTYSEVKTARAESTFFFEKMSKIKHRESPTPKGLECEPPPEGREGGPNAPKRGGRTADHQ